MNGLTDEKRRRLLNAAKKIHAHKLAQIKGYRRGAPLKRRGQSYKVLSGRRL